MRKAWPVLVTGAVLAISGCANSVGKSVPVGINLKVKSVDVANGVATDSKQITTESGNPYGGFIVFATAALGGKDPTVIKIDSLSLQLGAGSTGVTALEQVYTGRVDLVFLMNDT